MRDNNHQCTFSRVRLKLKVLQKLE